MAAFSAPMPLLWTPCSAPHDGPSRELKDKARINAQCMARSTA
jgi:hypothetical protein